MEAIQPRSMNLTPTLNNFVNRLKVAHARCEASARVTVLAMIECGRIVKAIRAGCEHGQWAQCLKSAGIAETTARRYMQVAEVAAKNPKRVQYLLENGSSFVEVMREFALVKPCKGAGYSPEDYQARKGQQLELNFNYEFFVSQVAALNNAPNVEQLGESSLVKLQKDLAAAQKRVEAILADRRAVELDPGNFLEDGPPAQRETRNSKLETTGELRP